MTDARGHCARLVAALGFLRLRQPTSELATLHQWTDSWRGLGAIVTGMGRQGYHVSITRYTEGWRATFLQRDHLTRPWVDQVLTFHPTPRAAVQHATWPALTRQGCTPS